MDTKRIIYLFLLAAAIGLTLVFLRTSHVQAVYHAASLRQNRQQLHQKIWQQQARMSRSIHSPKYLKESVQQLGIGLCPPQDIRKMDEQLAKQ